jgi:sugar transferase (PEP-CTERM/EpsH1 system associated)
MAPYLLRAPIAPERVLFDMVDIDSDKWRQYAARSRGGVKWLYGREAEKLQALECVAAGAFGHTLLASDFEADTFKAIAPASAGKISGLTNGVDLDRFAPGNFENPFDKDELPIVMTGRMDYRPNYEGALWFAQEVFPQVLKFIPNARVHFVGSGPPAQLRGAAGSGVVVTGAVADVRPYIQSARAVIAPLHIARGIQNKVLEAMAMAKPVVATHDATRSLGVKAGHHLWVENEPRRFANAVVEALQGPDRESLARNARGYVEVHHNWAGLMKDFARHLELLQPSRADICDVPVAPRPATGQQLEFSAPCKS